VKLSPERKLAGILEPVFAMRTDNDLGVGDTDGVRQMIDWCHRHGLGILQVLPINETSDDNSPYNAISSMALEPTTIAVSPEHLPDLTAARFKALTPARLLRQLRAGPVCYSLVKPLKRALLREAFKAFRAKHLARPTPRSDRFRAFLAQHGDWISDYALFRVLMEEHNNWSTWDRWPREHQHPRRAWTWLLALPAKRRADLTDKLLFFLYVQWIAYSQWTELKEYAARRNVRLMGDIPFGVSRYSADVWADPTLFDLDWCGGAPPEKFFRLDEFTVKWGQNWGIPLYRWDLMARRGYDWWRTRVGNIHRVFHLFRIDHVLGFFRIYAFPWKPEDNAKFTPLTEEQANQITGGRLPGFKPYPDDTPEHREFNRSQGASLLRMVLEAAGDTTVVAEDLGVVPDYVEPTLQQLGVPGFKIPHFLREPDGSFKDPRRYPRLSLVTPATHDHPPLAAWWRELRERARCPDPREARPAATELGHALRFCGLPADASPPPAFDDRIHEAYLRTVLESNSWLAVFMITDVFGQQQRFNVPGAQADSNWTARLDHTVRELDRDPVVLAKTRTLERLITQSRRCP
jgi:4-alpha-glucanotransferase